MFSQGFREESVFQSQWQQGRQQPQSSFYLPSRRCLLLTCTRVLIPHFLQSVRLNLYSIFAQSHIPNAYTDDVNCGTNTGFSADLKQTISSLKSWHEIGNWRSAGNTTTLYNDMKEFDNAIGRFKVWFELHWQDGLPGREMGVLCESRAKFMF